MVGDIDVNDRIAMVFMQKYCQAVIEHMFFERYIQAFVAGGGFGLITAAQGEQQRNKGD